jgi:hypothetical protein
MFWRAYSHGSASMAALAGGEIGANRQVCPTIVDGNVKLRPLIIPNFHLRRVRSLLQSFCNFIRRQRRFFRFNQNDRFNS